MLTIISHNSHSDIGGTRTLYEDRVQNKTLTTPSGLPLTLSAIADGSGGPHKGDRAAQTAMDAFFTYLERSKETDIPALLALAVQYANKAVYQISQETGGATTTFTAAVVTADDRLFIANVGNGRVYLVRNQKLTQLTRDHTYANVAPWSGQISTEEAIRHTQANAIIWKLGKKPEVTIDLGFYVGTDDFNEANARKDDGLPLQKGDAVLVCSDGLVKENAKGQPLITDAEMVRTLHEKEGKTAAKELVSFALGRGADDNISVAIIQMPDPTRKWRGRRSLLAVSAASLLIICVLVVGLAISFLRARQTGEQASALAQIQAQTASAQAIVNLTNTQQAFSVAAYTPTPSATPTATLPPFVPGQAGIILTENAPAFTLDQSLPAAEHGLQLSIYHIEGFAPPAYLFAFPNSLLRFESINDQAFQLSITQGSQLFVETGKYIQAVIKPVNTAGLTLTLDRGCVAVDNTQADTLLVSCYAGTCDFDVFGGTSGEISSGQEMLLDTINLTLLTTQTIPIEEARAWTTQLPGGSAAHNCAAQYVPTPTLIPTQNTGEQPAKNIEDDEGGANTTPPGGGAEQTPIPPTATSRPSSSSTPVNTAFPPTATPKLPFTPTPTSLPSVTLTPTQPALTVIPPATPAPPSPTGTQPSSTPARSSTPVPPTNTPKCPGQSQQQCTDTPKP